MQNTESEIFYFVKWEKDIITILLHAKKNKLIFKISISYHWAGTECNTFI